MDLAPVEEHGMRETARSYFPWMGNKERMAPDIRQVFPPKFSPYAEPFGGSGSVLLGLPADPGRLDIYNDLDENLSNLFLCVKEKTGQLLQELGFLPIHSRALFQLYKDFLAHKELHWEVYERNVREELALLDDQTCFTKEQAEELRPILKQRLELFDVHRAAIFYQNIRGSFSGTVTSFGVKVPRIYTAIPLILAASRRLEDVVIESKDAVRLIQERDQPEALFYCDPPYYDAEKCYQPLFSKRAHVRLWRTLLRCKGYVVLSYNDCAYIRNLYKDFYIIAFRRDNPLAKKQGAEYKELLITNYDPRPFMTSQLTLFDAPAMKLEMELVHIPHRPLKIVNF